MANSAISALQIPIKLNFPLKASYPSEPHFMVSLTGTFRLILDASMKLLSLTSYVKTIHSNGTKTETALQQIKRNVWPF